MSIRRHPAFFVSQCYQASTLFEIRTDHPRISLLLRLPPPNVSLTPEVRCAVVGNVDSGKSTTLGVLTRGMVPP
jgi:polynucleotide 5'-kinase involved in rRNA processing